MSDPIADLITRIRNGYLAKKLYVTAPYSKLKEGVAEVLAEYELLGEIKVNESDDKKELTIYLAYDEDGEPAVEHLSKISKPGLRKYWKADEIPTIRGGFGMAILTTNQGVMSSEEARKSKIGGEPLVKVY